MGYDGAGRVAFAGGIIVIIHMIDIAAAFGPSFIGSPHGAGPVYFPSVYIRLGTVPHYVAQSLVDGIRHFIVRCIAQPRSIPHNAMHIFMPAHIRHCRIFCHRSAAVIVVPAERDNRTVGRRPVKCIICHVFPLIAPAAVSVYMYKYTDIFSFSRKGISFERFIKIAVNPCYICHGIHSGFIRSFLSFPCHDIMVLIIVPVIFMPVPGNGDRDLRPAGALIDHRVFRLSLFCDKFLFLLLTLTCKFTLGIVRKIVKEYDMSVGRTDQNFCTAVLGIYAENIHQNRFLIVEIVYCKLIF